MHIIVVTPTGKYTSRGPTYAAHYGERQILNASTQPLLDAARVLLADGIAPADQIAMRRAGSDTDDMVSTVGYAAARAVSETHGPPRFTRWHQNPLAWSRPCVPGEAPP